MAKQLGLHRHVCRRFIRAALLVIPDLAFCDICFRRWDIYGAGLFILVPSEVVRMIVHQQDEIIASAAKELGIPYVFLVMNGQYFGPPIKGYPEMEAT